MPLKTGPHIWLPVAGFALAVGGTAFAENQNENMVEPGAGATTEPMRTDANAMDPLDENFEQQTRGTAFFDWTLDDFLGATVIDSDGAVVGSVSNVVRDDGDDVYLVTALTGETGGHVVPFDMFDAGSPMGTLVLADASTSTVDAIALYGEHMDAYTEVQSDTRLFDLLNPSGMARDE